MYLNDACFCLVLRWFQYQFSHNITQMHSFQSRIKDPGCWYIFGVSWLMHPIAYLETDKPYLLHFLSRIQRFSCTNLPNDSYQITLFLAVPLTVQNFFLKSISKSLSVVEVFLLLGWLQSASYISKLVLFVSISMIVKIFLNFPGKRNLRTTFTLLLHNTIC